MRSSSAASITRRFVFLPVARGGARHVPRNPDASRRGLFAVFREISTRRICAWSMVLENLVQRRRAARESDVRSTNCDRCRDASDSLVPIC
jgi:hypothetical protein